MSEADGLIGESPRMESPRGEDIAGVPGFADCPKCKKSWSVAYDFDGGCFGILFDLHLCSALPADNPAITKCSHCESEFVCNRTKALCQAISYTVGQLLESLA